MTYDKLRSLFLSLIFLIPLSLSAADPSIPEFDPTIPVVDLNDFHNPETKAQFVADVATALHDIGFFAVINTGMDQSALDDGYSAIQTFFSAPLDTKFEIYNPSLNGQRGYVPSERAQGQQLKDFKEFLHIGKQGNLWPIWMDLQTPMERLRDEMDQLGVYLQQAFALALGEEEDLFTEMTETGECLLRPVHYPANPTPGRFWAAQHTDIDLFTILPMATEDGLQVLHNGEWISVRTPAGAVVINAGDKLQNITNGYFKSAVHRVMSKPNVERYSIVYFIHPRDDDCMCPRRNAIALTGGVKRFPDATSLELLASRLRELLLASPELLQFERDSGIIDRIRDLVEAGVADPSVVRTYELWLAQQQESAN
jgi:isopenicillin N synthase-like dioxygenase